MTVKVLYLIPVYLFFLLPVACDRDQKTVFIDLEDKVSETELMQHKHDKKPGRTLTFGFDLRASPQEDARQYLPFLKYLENSTGYHFKLRFTPKNNSIVDELGQNIIQLAAIGADSYIEAYEKYQAICLVRGVNDQGKAEYRSVIVIHPDSKIKSIADLKGKRMAFGDINSTQGHLIPRIVLTQHHMSLNDFSYLEYTGSHLNCVNSVISKKSDACGMQDTMAKEMAGQGLVRILYTSDYYPSSGITISKNLPADVIAKIKQALLAFDPEGKHKQGLYNWNKTEMPKGFVEANTQDYAELRKWSIRLGLLNSGTKTTQN